MQAAACGLDAYDLLAFSSAQAVERFLVCVPQVNPLHTLKVAAVGSATADALIRRGIPVSIIPSVFTGEGLLAAISDTPEWATPGRALILGAQEGRDVVPIGLRSMGWQVDKVTAYRTEYNPSKIRIPLRSLLEHRELGAILLTASGVARTLAQALGQDGLELLQGVELVSIGQVTTETAQRWGLTVRISASASTFKGLVEAWAETLSHPADSRG
jgi:uroporphyrinogen III methyltransferase/synthase